MRRERRERRRPATSRSSGSRGAATLRKCPRLGRRGSGGSPRTRGDATRAGAVPVGLPGPFASGRPGVGGCGLRSPRCADNFSHQVLGGRSLTPARHSHVPGAGIRPPLLRLSLPPAPRAALCPVGAPLPQWPNLTTLCSKEAPLAAPKRRVSGSRAGGPPPSTGPTRTLCCQRGFAAPAASLAPSGTQLFVGCR